MDTVADWCRLTRGLSWYQSKGYRYAEAHWLVSRDYTMLTCPDERYITATEHSGDLVGSAEQSLLFLDGEGMLPRGKFVACTPCFRAESDVTDIHRQYFMKVELYQNEEVNEDSLQKMIADAEAFFRSELPPGAVLAREETPEGLDLTVNGIEVGSYGIRRARNLEWVYGTGIAEPRFSAILRR